MKDKKKTYKEIHGTTRIGDFLRSLDYNKVAEVVAKVATGNVKGAIEAISKDEDELSPEQREYALKLIELDLQETESITRRWESDMKADSWLSKNVRPMTLLFLTKSTVALMIADSHGVNFNVDTEWIDLLKSLLITVFVAYFGGRSFEKTKRL